MLHRLLCIAAWICCVGTISLAAASSSPDVDAFHTWISDGGGTLQGVRVGETKNMGRGVLATTALSEGDRILSMPLSLVLCRATILAALDGDRQVKKMLAAVEDDTDLVVLFLLRESGRGDASAWAPYISLLPPHVPVPATFSAAELGEVQDDFAVKQARETRARIVARHAALKQSGTLGAVLAKSTKKLLHAADAFIWADSIVNSRALTLAGKKYLVPFADMTNYAPHSGAASRRNDAGSSFLKYHRLGSSTFDVFTDRDVAAGEQMFEDYGDNDGDLYFHHHAMVPSMNPFDCVRITAPAPPAGSDREALIKLLGVPMTPTECISPTRQLSAGMRYHLWLLMMEEKSARKCSARVKASPRRGAAGCFKGKTEQDIFQHLAVGALMRSTIERELRSYPTSLDEDRALLATRSALSSAVALAVSFRSTRKQMLHEVAARFGAPQQPDVSSSTPPTTAADAADDNAASATLDERLIAQAAVHLKVQATVGIPPNDRGRLLLQKLGLHVETLLALSAKASTPPPVKTKEPTALEDSIARFNEWFDREAETIAHISPMRVKATAVPFLRIGVVTREGVDVKPEEVYLGVPPTTLMDRESAARSPALIPVFATLAKKFKRGDPFHELLFHLIYERFVLREESFWWPYLSLLPHGKDNMQPIYYSVDALKRLEGSMLHAQVLAQKEKVSKSYKSVKRVVFDTIEFFKTHAEAFSYENYKWAHAILDSRSIWWTGERHLSPMLDFVNCAQGPESPVGSGRRVAARVHSTGLDDKTGTVAITKAPWAFPSGSQVYENYGQPNYIYFLHHGFSLEDNDSDCVQVPFDSRNAREQVYCLAPNAIPEELLQSMGREGLLYAIEAHLRGYPTDSENMEHESAAALFVRSEKKLLRELIVVLDSSDTAEREL